MLIPAFKPWNEHIKNVYYFKYLQTDVKGMP